MGYIHAKDFLYSERHRMKRLSEILKMSEKELTEYLREADNTVQPTDILKIISFEHGIKVFYHHKDQEKPYKTRVFLRGIENSDLLK
ncbi:MAG: hypothetical protein AUI61_00905 [Thaumarchaeota archaeon 13_1_40CM_2_39_13_2]|nr:MAG: hypothetical protein AUI61_00905 [Thaumarchaeota archaeon 13_1_40CM_2_39_13_2]OLE40559.1 MAG: hypothetical protein AUG16_03595 [Thaumarchaeota archaeon 13_1_20CM_2_39_20]